MLSSFTHVVTNSKVSFSLQAELFLCTHVPCPPGDGHWLFAYLGYCEERRNGHVAFESQVLSGHMVALFYISFEKLVFSAVAAPIYGPTSTAEGPRHSASSPALIISCLLDGNNSDRCEVVSHGGFDLRFSDN